MTIITGNLWDELGKANVILVTTNAQTRKDGALVMGRGAALEAIERFPQLPFNLGRKIEQKKSAAGVYRIALDLESRQEGTVIGAFQVKYHWRDDADLKLIRMSCKSLAIGAARRPHQRFALNFPGIGNGRLKEADVLPILETLPDNVFVYKLP